MKITPLLIIAALAVPMAQAGPGRKSRTAKEVVFTQYFEEADADGNDILDFEEFSNSYGATANSSSTTAGARSTPTGTRPS